MQQKQCERSLTAVSELQSDISADIGAAIETMERERQSTAAFVVKVVWLSLIAVSVRVLQRFCRFRNDVISVLTVTYLNISRSNKT